MSRRRLLPAALALLAALSAHAEKQSPPPPAPAAAFRLPPTSQYTLPGGTRVTLVPYGDVPKVNVVLVMHAGNADEAPGHTGLADLAGKLLLEGTTSRSAEQLAQAAADLGGSLDVVVGQDESTVGIECLGEFAARAVALVAEVVRHPALPESELARLKNDLVRQLTLERSRQQPLAREAFDRAIYGSHPYGHPLAEAAEVKTFTLAEVKKFLGSYVGANRAHLYVIGRFDEAAVRGPIAEAFAGWARSPGGKRPAARPRTERAVYFLDRAGAVQSTVLLGLPVVPPTSPDFIALSVTNTLLGGSFGSRITANIREKRGYTYSPFSALTTHPGVGTWAEAADVTTKDTAAAVQEVVNEVERLRSESPGADELAGFQRFMSGTFVRVNSSRLGILGQLRFVELYGLPPDWLSSYVARVNAITPADVTRMAKKYLDPARMTLVVVGDRQTVASALAPFGKVVLVTPPASPAP